MADEKNSDDLECGAVTNAAKHIAESSECLDDADYLLHTYSLCLGAFTASLSRVRNSNDDHHIKSIIDLTDYIIEQIKK